MRYEDGLAALFRNGLANLELMVLAHLGGLADRLPGWLALARQAYAMVDPKTLRRLFDAVLTVDVGTIETALRKPDVQNVRPALFAFARSGRAHPEWLDVALGAVIKPLTLLGRGDVVSRLHANSLDRLGAGAKSSVTGEAAFALGKAGDWAHALEILDHAGRNVADINIGIVNESLLWQYAYLHRQVESVMPALASAPFNADVPDLVGYRAWKLKAYQIRAGMARVDVPVIEGEQPHGYKEAAAMQIEALADDPSAADIVGRLRTVLRPRVVETIHADRGWAASVDHAARASLEAAAQVAARRRDYARAAAVAASPSPLIYPIDPAMAVINAFLEEGDWRGAAAIAKDHDPRTKAPDPDSYDTRIQDYVDLYCLLALAAAWSGDDAAAAEFLAKAKQADREDPDQDGVDTDQAFLWVETLLAGAAEGVLPRNYLDVLTTGHFNPG